MRDEPGVRIRAATEADLDQVGRITEGAYAEFMVGEEHAHYRPQLRDAGPRFREAELLVAVDALGEVVGAVTVCPLGSPWREIASEEEGEFRMLAVAPAARGQGVGEMLVRHVVDGFAAQGLTRTALSTLPQMTAAHRLYARLGFVRAPGRDWSPAPGVDLWAFTRPG
ncbi:GNAT family N-acetyltransferase [Nocardioides mangrovicus]|uniref:GNAT family N-acetyltransferase n=1 Tax=Nocardioides mangrovicus TaxID=2478913 RepID=A0A3L8P6G7_9ACTN|nr:GNAT family N-acetyltransferase [Nocardioides mangrovicus]RLV51000.1 GNAT family N-acetyltransferase [Nocardioides mangrovicus]